MAEKRIVKMVGQTTVVNTETNESVAQPIAIIENIIQNNVTNIIQNSTVIQETISNSVTNIVETTTIIQESPQIAGIISSIENMNIGIEIIEEQNQSLSGQISSVSNALTSKASTIAVQEVAETVAATNQALGGHVANEANPHSTTKEQTGIRVEKGTILFVNEIQKTVLFASGYFTGTPEVPITLVDPDGTPPYRVTVSKEGMIVKVKTRFSGLMTYIATQI